MIKKILKIILCLIIIAIPTCAFAGCNLKSNSVFYAQHTPHKEGVEPVLMEVASEMNWIYTPDIDGIEYRSKGNQAIYNRHYKREVVAYFTYYDDGTYTYSNADGLNFTFDEHFQLLDIWNSVTNSFEQPSTDLAKIKEEIYLVVQPVIDAQPTPIINLQWLYDLVNHDRFN